MLIKHFFHDTDQIYLMTHFPPFEITIVIGLDKGLLIGSSVQSPLAGKDLSNNTTKYGELFFGSSPHISAK